VCSSDLALSNSVPAYGGCDRFVSRIGNWTTGTGTALQAVNFGGAGKYAQMVLATTTGTGGDIFIGQRIESFNVSDLNGKTITISANVYHDVGSPVNVQMFMFKPDALDTYTTTTLVSAGAITSVQSGPITRMTHTFTLGAGDATNGLYPIVYFTPGVALTGKYFGVGEFQLEEGSIATPFEVRPVGLELALCQRYYEIGYFQWTLYQLSGGGYTTQQPFTVRKRAAPTVTVSGTGVINTTNSGVVANTTGIVQNGYASTSGAVSYSGNYAATIEL
jgi:hypothetical protein